MRTVCLPSIWAAKPGKTVTWEISELGKPQKTREHTILSCLLSHMTSPWLEGSFQALPFWQCQGVKDFMFNLFLGLESDSDSRSPPPTSPCSRDVRKAPLRRPLLHYVCHSGCPAPSRDRGATAGPPPGRPPQPAGHGLRRSHRDDSRVSLRA